MKKRGLILLTALLIFALVLFPHAGLSDAGGYAGTSDYGYSDHSESSNSGSDYSWSDSDSGYVSRSGGGNKEFLLPLFVFVAICILAGVIRSFKNKGNNRSVAPGATRTSASMLTPMENYNTLDPNFSAEDFKEQLQNLYIKMQDCCTKRDFEPVRPYFADSFYQQLNRQATRLKEAHQTNYVERIAVLSVDLKGYYQDKGEDVIIAELYTRITDYTLNDDTGALVSGSKTKEKFMTYEYALSRPIGRMTDPFRKDDVSERHCPNCGAPLSVNESIKCPFCGSVITFSDHDWTVYSIKGISQRTA